MSDAGRALKTYRKLWCAIVAMIATPSVPSVAFDCPVEMGAATRLVMVTTSDMNTVHARVKLLERPSPSEPWSVSMDGISAVVGKNGLGWGAGYRTAAQIGDPIKIEGDAKSPAGLFPLGRPFGFGPRPVDAYMRLDAEEHFCIADPRSPQYGTITSGPKPNGTIAEDMNAVAGYRSGLIVNYRSDREARSGSCIFLHVWRAKGLGTAGCIAFQDRDIEHIQHWARHRQSVIAVLPETRVLHFQKCLGQ